MTVVLVLFCTFLMVWPFLNVPHPETTTATTKSSFTVNWMKMQPYCVNWLTAWHCNAHESWVTSTMRKIAFNETAKPKQHNKLCLCLTLWFRQLNAGFIVVIVYYGPSPPLCQTLYGLLLSMACKLSISSKLKDIKTFKPFFTHFTFSDVPDVL